MNQLESLQNRNLKREIQKLSDEDLIKKMKDRAQNERETLIDILHHLQEINRRQLYLKKAYPTLHRYIVEVFGYSDGEAYRRIQAMRLLDDIPAVEEKLQQGILSLTNMAQAQNFFYQEKKMNKKDYCPAEKMQLLQKLENKSTKECEKVLKEISPLAMSQDRMSLINPMEYRMSVTISLETYEKLVHFKNLVSHRLKTGEWSEVISLLMDMGLEKLEEKMRLKQKSKLDITYKKIEEKTLNASIEKENEDQKSSEVDIKSRNVSSLAVKPCEKAFIGFKNLMKRTEGAYQFRYIPRVMKENIFKQAGYQCQYVDAKTKIRCSAKHYLQIDHIYPLAWGGKTEASNLRLLCQNHNQWVAKRMGLLNRK